MKLLAIVTLVLLLWRLHLQLFETDFNSRNTLGENNKKYLITDVHYIVSSNKDL